MSIHSLTHSFIYSSSNASGKPPRARLSSKFYGQRAESDPCLSRERSQSGGVKEATANPLNAFQQGAIEVVKTEGPSPPGSVRDGLTTKGNQDRALVFKQEFYSQGKGRAPLAKAPWASRENLLCGGSVSGDKARMFCEPCSSRALNCLALSPNGCVTRFPHLENSLIGSLQELSE